MIRLGYDAPRDPRAARPLREERLPRRARAVRRRRARAVARAARAAARRGGAAAARHARDARRDGREGRGRAGLAREGDREDPGLRERPGALELCRAPAAARLGGAVHRARRRLDPHDADQQAARRRRPPSAAPGPALLPVPARRADRRDLDRARALHARERLPRGGARHAARRAAARTGTRTGSS